MRLPGLAKTLHDRSSYTITRFLSVKKEAESRIRGRFHGTYLRPSRDTSQPASFRSFEYSRSADPRRTRRAVPEESSPYKCPRFLALAPPPGFLIRFLPQTRLGRWTASLLDPPLSTNFFPKSPWIKI